MQRSVDAKSAAGQLALARTRTETRARMRSWMLMMRRPRMMVLRPRRMTMVMGTRLSWRRLLAGQTSLEWV